MRIMTTILLAIILFPGIVAKAKAQPCIALAPAVGDDPKIVAVNKDQSVYLEELTPHQQRLNLPTYLGHWGTTRSRELTTATYVGNCPVLAHGDGNRLDVVQLNGPCVGEPLAGYMVDATSDRLGQHIAFTADYPVRPGLTANPNKPQVFLWDQSGNVITQITDGTATGSVGLGPTLAREGSLVAFSSNGDLTGQNPDGSFEVFLRDVATGQVTQVTNGVGCNSGTVNWGNNEGPSISEDGTRIAFVSTCNLTGGNPSGFPTVFLADLALGTTLQLAHCPGCNVADLPAISRDGSTVLNYDISGFGQTAVVPLMVHAIGSGSATTRSLCQPISTGQLSLGEAFVLFGAFNTPAVTEDGRRIAFTMKGNPTGANPVGFFEVFVMDLAADLKSGRMRQVTDGTDNAASLGVALDWKGSRLWTWGTYPGLGQRSQEILRVSLREP
jgi:Tol biopolymer transport system component